MHIKASFVLKKLQVQSVLIPINRESCSWSWGINSDISVATNPTILDLPPLPTHQRQIFRIQPNLSLT